MEFGAQIGESTQEHLARLRAHKNMIDAEVAALQEKLAQSATARMAEIREEVKKLLDEAEKLARDAGMQFYRTTFLNGIDDAYSSTYWEHSDYC